MTLSFPSGGPFTAISSSQHGDTDSLKQKAAGVPLRNK
jgi:hypothetical protein